MIKQLDLFIYKIEDKYFVCDSVYKERPKHELVEVEYDGTEGDGFIKNAIVVNKKIYRPGNYDLPSKFIRLDVVNMINRFIEIPKYGWVRVENTKSKNKIFTNQIFELKLQGSPCLIPINKKEAKAMDIKIEKESFI